MALTLKELIASQEKLKAKEPGTEVISIEEFKKLREAQEKTVEALKEKGGNAVNSNVVKLIDTVKDQTKIFESTLETSEERLERSRLEERNTKALEKIAENTEPKDNVALGKEATGLNFGSMLVKIAAGFGVLAGTVSALVKNMKFFVDLLTPRFVKNSIVKAFDEVMTFFKGFGDKVKTNLSKLFSLDDTSKMGKIFNSVKTSISSFVKFIEPVTDVVKSVFTGIKSAVTTFIKPFVAAFDILKGMLDGPIKVVSETLQTFKNAFGVVSKVVSKLLFPLFAIMTIWDTVKGAIEGFEEGGVAGAIGGAIKGLFNSIIFAPLDLLKSVVSWLLGKMGFEEAEKLLDSFSFEETFSKLIDTITNFFSVTLPTFITETIPKFFTEKIPEVFNSIVEWISGIPAIIKENLIDPIGNAFTEYIVDPLKDAFKPIGDFFSNIKETFLSAFEDFEIPGVSFEAFGKKFGFGPWYPFRPDKDDTRITATSKLSEKAVTDEAGETTREKTFGRNIVASTEKDTVVSAKQVDEAGLTSVRAKLDTTTGKVSYVKEGEEGVEEREISKGAFAKAKELGKQGASPELIDKAVKEYEQYEKLSWWDRRKVDLGISTVQELSQKAEAINAVAPIPGMADGVYNRSAENADAAVAAVTGGSVVVAPTTVNNSNQAITYRSDVRNQDSSLRRMNAGSYVAP